jgi:hypothetical protein
MEIVDTLLVILGFILGFIGTAFFRWREKNERKRMTRSMVLCEIKNINIDARLRIASHEAGIILNRKCLSDGKDIPIDKIPDADLLTTVYTSIARDLGLLDEDFVHEIIDFYSSVNRANNSKRDNQIHCEKALELCTPTKDGKGLVKHPLAIVRADYAQTAAEKYIAALKEITTSASIMQNNLS